MRELVELEEAQFMLEEQVGIMGVEAVTLPEGLGRVAAEDLVAPMSIPPFDRSPLDGYALRAADTLGAIRDFPVELRVIEEIPAGRPPAKRVGSGQAAKVLTGAPIPEGADVVVRYEDVKVEADRLFISHPLKAYANYCFAGEDTKKGEVIVPQGLMLTPAALGLLAGMGIKEMPVFKKPKIGILSTGDELVDISEELGPGQIYNSSIYFLTAMIQQQGAIVSRAHTIGDSETAVANELEKMLDISDMVITTGGVSVGDYDVILRAVTRLGAQVLFWRVNMRPGTAVLGAVKDGKVVICLSGNPGAAFVSFHLLAEPVIRKLAGVRQIKPFKGQALLQEEFKKKSSQRRFLRAVAYIEKGSLMVKMSGLHNSGIMKSALNCNALIDVPVKSGELVAGAKVDVVLLNSSCWREYNEPY